MIHSVTFLGFVSHRQARALFLPRGAQHVRSKEAVRELVRALLALAGALSWGAVMLLLSAG